MLDGTVVQARAGHYTVRTASGTYDCLLRGRFRKDGTTVLVGDKVRITEIAPSSGVIEEVLPRQSQLIRPPVANVDQAVIVCAITSPEPDLILLDRLLVVVAREGIGTVICFNKADLASDYAARKLAGPYRRAGYTCIITSARTGKGIPRLRRLLAGHISVFAGPSGVGKSAILNAVEPGFALKTGEISERLGRGRHTTRHVELLEISNGGFVLDTPGFSRLSIEEIKRDELRWYFPELAALEGRCRFQGCLHHREPDCAVKQAVDRKEIARSRYDHYVMFLEEVMSLER
ncbi:MAG TPA: ribosome small subunit-dependent GTPase A [Firmicutes bacterium]|nr:ribosome small subunit-dependent GTPase A [Bacillota bacterium]